MMIILILVMMMKTKVSFGPTGDITCFRLSWPGTIFHLIISIRWFRLRFLSLCIFSVTRRSRSDGRHLLTYLLSESALALTWLMWPLWVMIPIEDLTDVTLAIEDTDEDDEDDEEELSDVTLVSDDT